MKYSTKVLMTLTGLLMAGCSSGGGADDGSTTTVSATKPSSVVESLSSKISEVGTNMNAAMNGASIASIHTMSGIDTKCGVHGEPLFQPVTTDSTACTNAGGSWNPGSSECKMSSSDHAYTGMKFFCFIAKDTGSPDSLQGAFGLFGNLSCSLEKQGMQWDGVQRTMDVTLSESNGCFQPGQLSDGPCEGQSSCSMSVNVTACTLSGQYYDSSLNLKIGTIYYRAKVKVSDGITELAVSNNGHGVVNDEDVYSVRLDETNKRFAYEGRFDRIDALGCGSSCGWSRHYIVANLLDWVQEVEDKGLEKVRKIPGYHDEPLVGTWKGYRSIRLSRSYRAIYVEHSGELRVITIVEVNKHEY